MTGSSGTSTPERTCLDLNEEENRSAAASV